MPEPSLSKGFSTLGSSSDSSAVVATEVFVNAFLGGDVPKDANAKVKNRRIVISVTTNLYKFQKFTGYMKKCESK